MARVTADGLLPDDAPDWTTPEAPGAAVLLAPGEDARRLGPHLARIALVGVSAAAFNDGRAFSAARRLRAMGYRGRLRLVGPIVPDQWPLARAVGFDEASVPDAVAARQPAEAWARAERLRPAPLLARRRPAG